MMVAFELIPCGSPSSSCGPTMSSSLPPTHFTACLNPVGCVRHPITTLPSFEMLLARVDLPLVEPRSTRPRDASQRNARAKEHPFHARPTTTLPSSVPPYALDSRS